MAQFKQWALEYVLSDDEAAQSAITQKAAREIESSRASSTVVGSWAASVQQWMTPANADDERMDNGDEAGSGDIIARAKALGFLAGTLEALDKSVLRSDQVLRLVGFFGAMFSYDHKAGITASAKALRRLYAMKGFKPDMGIKIMEDVCKIQEDFRLQTASTRLEVYELFVSLIQDSAVSSELKHKYGPSCGFVVDLLQVCQSERDPRNLMVWFKILAVLLADYEPSPEVTEEIFKVFSAYFPISLRSSAAPIGITAEDLKEAVRSCFAAHQRVANHAFPFLIQKLDQGDAVTVAVKVDILKTIKACIEQYSNPHASIVPHIENIWSSLKYEVRNGEVKETIDATLEVLRAMARKLDGTKTHKFDGSLLSGYVDLVSRDCRDDLANPTYTKQAGLLLMTVISANIRAYVLYNAGFIDTIRQNLRQPKSPSHSCDLLLLLNSLLKSRMELFKNRNGGHPDDEGSLRTEPHAHLDTLFHDVYLPIWTAKGNEPASEEKDILKQVIQGLALLVSQQVLQPDGTAVLLCPTSVCSEICSLLTVMLTKGLTLSSNDNHGDDEALEGEAVLALRTIVMIYHEGYAQFMRRAIAEVQKRDWASPSEYSLSAFRDLLSRSAFIGCSEIPSSITSNASSPRQFSPLQHFITLTARLLEIFPLSTQSTSLPPTGSTQSWSANAHIISSLHASVLWFREACEVKYGREVLASQAGADTDWSEEFQQLPNDWLLRIQSGDAPSDAAQATLTDSGPEVYRQFLRVSIFIVRHFYRLASSGARGPWDERALVQLSRMTALVVRSLDEKLQVSCNLAAEAFNFFNSDSPPAQQSVRGLQEGLLTLGILQGMRPGALAGLYELSGEAERYMCDTTSFGHSASQESDVRAAIGAILVNKYKDGPASSDRESLLMKRVLDFWANWIKEATASSSVDTESFAYYNKLAMNVIAGAAARQDKHVLGLIPVLHQAAASQHGNGERVAESLGLVVKQNDILTPDNHAVVKRFYKQWVYGHLVRPLLQDAQPGAKDAHTATRYRVAVLSVISNCPFTVYQDDLEPLMRLLVSALKNRAGLSEGIAWSHVVSALEILAEILANEPDALKGYLREVIGGTTEVYQECVQKKSAAMIAQPATRTLCRKLALHILGAIPTRFEERHVLAFAPPTQRLLAVACGDPVRKVREVARRARSAWAKVV
ncbi:Dos2-interacting transcription regulator of RNA-Pol-II-domain-containing protein [Chaetomium strumarium]|uniref:MMS19 nucleotide excision repair protein n=1 Tax=Chaetomium strumarium TaxID=1170767 RepID=A0AAJ0H3N8_9PEZI|nr:Dos2-interacting transcription regulator of RNA-Pol-II-domain-containing protein [Chaetomium strumarium]